MKFIALNIQRTAASHSKYGYEDKFKVIPKNIQKYFDEKILKLKNLKIVDLDHNELEFLQIKGLLDENLIKPLYLG